MNRRMALMLTLMTGGLVTARAQADGDDDFDDPPPKRKASTKSARTRKAAAGGDEDDDSPPAREVADDAPPADFRSEAGHAWKSYDIARYTALAYDPDKNPQPQDEIVQWIFRRTGTADWHGDKITVLSAGRAALRVYHNPRMLKIVDGVVKQFTRAVSDYLTVRVRFFAAADTRWRYAVHSRLTPVATGPQGQHIWSLRTEDANLLYTQLQIYQNFRVLVDRRVKMVNGQTLTISHGEPVDYIRGPQRDGPVGLGMQPGAGQLREEVVLRFSPLLTYDGDALDAGIDLRTNTIRRLISTSILTRREVGPNDLAISVPDATETRINVPIKDWPIGQSLLISGGITPGILQTNKDGFLSLRLPGTVPKDTELLALIDVEPVANSTARAPRDRG